MKAVLLLISLSLSIFVGTGHVLVEPQMIIYPPGTVVKMTAIPDNNGTYFEGFIDDQNRIYKSPELTIIMDSNKVFWAYFFEKHFRITRIDKGGTIQLSPARSYYLWQDVVQASAVPSAGNKFVEWKGTYPTTANPIQFVIDSNVVLEAIFTPIIPPPPPTGYTLTITALNGSVVKKPDQFFYLNTDVQITAIPNKGFKFWRWSGDLSGNKNPAIVRMDRNKKIQANFR